MLIHKNGTKICSMCKIAKSLSKYRKNKYEPDGYFHYCKPCHLQYEQEWRAKHREKSNKWRKKWKQNNPEKVKLGNKSYRERNRELIRIRNRIWSKANPDKERAKAARLRSTVKGKLKGSISSGINQCLRGNKKGHHWEELVGFTGEELKKHIETQFSAGMSWDNYGIRGWHIDHIIPISFFQFTSPKDTEFRMCWRLENLQPLWAKDNLCKSNKLKIA